MRYRQIDNGPVAIPMLGQGTGIGGGNVRYAKYPENFAEVLRFGVNLGMNFIDTAEVYGDGEAEKHIGKTINGIRDRVLISTKFSPDHNSSEDVIQSAEESLKRLQTDYIDFYQVHWPTPRISLTETLLALKKLKDEKKIRYIGVCNFSFREIKKAQSVLEGALNSIQMEYNLFDRSAEKDVLPFCQQNNIVFIAYSPLAKGKIAPANKLPELMRIADKYKKSIVQIVLNWIIMHDSVLAIPNATKIGHLKENSEAADFILSENDFNDIDEYIAKKTIELPVGSICAFSESEKDHFSTIDDALTNKLGFVPSPLELANDFLKHSDVKPIKVAKISSNKFEYILLEGRLRYWGWVIARGMGSMIPAIIVD